ncbi:hypothetical protein EBZ39_02665 [bacterium]|nr:hypothetical protein [bacterium]
MAAFLPSLRIITGAILAAWLGVSLIGVEIDVMCHVPAIEKTMARDIAYGYEQWRWYYEHIGIIACVYAIIGGLIGARLRFPSELS